MELKPSTSQNDGEKETPRCDEVVSQSTQGQSVVWRGPEEENGDTLTPLVLCIAGSTIKPTFFVLQSKPLIPLQKEEDPETHKTVLTNYMFPQQIRTDDCEYCAFSKAESLFSSSQTFKLHLFLIEMWTLLV